MYSSNDSLQSVVLLEKNLVFDHLQLNKLVADRFDSTLNTLRFRLYDHQSIVGWRNLRHKLVTEIERN